MSVLAKTEHLPAMRGGRFERRANSPNSSMAIPSRLACWSRKDPVPAAQREFIEKSFKIRTPEESSLKRISLESWPPISIRVFISLRKFWAARCAAVTSFMNSFFNTDDRTLLPLPVKVTAEISEDGICLKISRRIKRGRPLWRR